jgi:hypothetical protein|tara:strand:+ start:457 stop:684 length:228 start_codon:yes stop_codon:yes gene_type:complete
MNTDKSWHGGKGSNYREVNTETYSQNFDQAFRKMTCEYWAKREGHDYHKIDFSSQEINEFDKISYTEYKKRFPNQ